MGDDNSSSPTTNTDRLNSFHPECNDLKYQYDQCFNSWFTEHYMNGHYNNDKCQKVFEIYTNCVKVSIIFIFIDEIEFHLNYSLFKRKV